MNDLIAHFTVQLAAAVVAAIIAAVGTAYGAFKWLGKKWLESRFAERLEAFKHTQNREIEELRFRISALLDRTAKLHQNEFEVLPEVWDRLTIDLSAALALTSRLQSYPNLDQMGAGELEDVLSKSPLVEWERGQIRELEKGKRQNAYQEMIFWHTLRNGFAKHADFHNYFISKGIFVHAGLKEKFRAMSNLIYDALQEQHQQKQCPTPGEARFTKSDKLHAEAEDKLKEIEGEVQDRLWNTNKLV